MEKLLPHANLTASETSAGKPSAEPPPAGQQAHKTTSELLKDCMTSQNLNSMKLKCSRYLFTPMLLESGEVPKTLLDIHSETAVQQSAVKLHKCFMDNKTSPDFPSA